MSSGIKLEEFIVADRDEHSGEKPFVKLRMEHLQPDPETDANNVVRVSVSLPRVAGQSIEAYRDAADRKAIEILKETLETFERLVAAKG